MSEPLAEGRSDGQGWGVITTETGRGSLAGLPALLDLLGRQPTPEMVVEALVAGAAGPFGVRAAILLVVDGEQLRLVGSHGFSPAELAGFDVISLATDLPVSRAVREGEAVVSSISGTVAVPVTADGVPVAAYGFTCATERSWSVRDLQLLDAVGSALALWLSHPDTGLTAASDPRSSSAILTPRQCAILQLVADGRTTEAIGATLGYSSSTVKQDIQRAMRVLDVTTREAAAARARELGLCPGAAT